MEGKTPVFAPCDQASAKFHLIDQGNWGTPEGIAVNMRRFAEEWTENCSSPTHEMYLDVALTGWENLNLRLKFHRHQAVADDLQKKIDSLREKAIDFDNWITQYPTIRDTMQRHPTEEIDERRAWLQDRGMELARCFHALQENVLPETLIPDAPEDEARNAPKGSDAVQLHPQAYAILRVLKNSPMLLAIEDIAGKTGLPKDQKTVGGRINELIDLHFACRKSKKSGVGITDEGRKFLAPHPA